MEKIQCYNSDGEYIDSLVQWDQGQVIYIDNLESGAIPNVHFAFSGNDVSWEFSNITSLSNNKIKVNIPNAVMQYCGRLYLFFYYGDGNTYTTKYVGIITIKEKPRPGDYVYEDNTGSSVSVSQLRTDINSLFSIVDTKITSPTKATVGHFLKVSVVDSNGKPTKWEAVDIQSVIETSCKTYIETELLGGAS